MNRILGTNVLSPGATTFVFTLARAGDTHTSLSFYVRSVCMLLRCMAGSQVGVDSEAASIGTFLLVQILVFSTGILVNSCRY